MPRVAVVHDWLTVYGGAERVLEEILACYPDADLFSMVDFVPEGQRAFLGGRAVNTSVIQRLPFARAQYRSYLPLMPLAVEQFDLSAYDLILSSSYAVAKGVLTGPDQLHLSYVHSPVRYAWDLQAQYLREAGLERGLKSWLARWMLHRIRLWDVRTANGVDAFAANSRFIARRIWKVYRREAEVIYPPVDLSAFGPGGPREEYYVTASRLVPYKRVDLIVDAFASLPDRQLVVVGDGPEMPKLRAKAGPNVRLLGYQAFPELLGRMQRARAFVFAAEEDFGIVPVEAQACGTPVIAYGKGGALESVIEGTTGMFFHDQTPQSLAAAIRAFEFQPERYRADRIRKNAERFDRPRFRREFAAFVEREWDEFCRRRSIGGAQNPSVRSES